MQCNQFKLKDLLEIKNGTDYRNIEKGTIPVYGSGGYMTSINKWLYDGESILLPRKGTINNIMFVNGKFWTVDTMYWSIINKQKVVPYYLYNYLKALNFNNLYTGSTLPSMTNSAYYSIPVNLPSFDNQKKLAHILKIIDKKIELNNQINQELETVTNTLYNYWFIQFDFPDENERPYKSSGGAMVYNEILKREIPINFEIIKLKDICEVKSGYPFSSDNYDDNGEYKLITIKNVQDNYISSDTDNNIGKIPNNMPDYCILKDGDILLSLTGNVGRIGMTFEENLLLNQRVGLLKLKEKSCHSYIYLTFLSEYFKNTLEKNSTGSNQKNLSPVETEKLPIIYSKTIMENFEKRTKPIIDKMINNYKENKRLAILRDFLLPMLMNGQVTVRR